MANRSYNLSTWNIEDSGLQMTETNPVENTISKDRALIERALNHKHMIETVERFEWKNLPPEIPSDLIERVIYHRFKGVLIKALERFYFLPFTLKGEQDKTIDSYGRYINITPVLFTGAWRGAGDGDKVEHIEFITDKSWDVVYDIPQETAEEEVDQENKEVNIVDNENKCVILTDSSLEISQDYTPMSQLAKPWNEQLTDILVLVNMDLISSAKCFYIVAKDESQKDAIERELVDLDDRILNGRRFVVLTSAVQLQELTGSPVKDTARYFQSYQSLDNLRKDLIGQDNGGTFLKQEHMTDQETSTNSNSGSAVLKNALRMRKDFCKLANAVFPELNIEVDITESEEQPIVEKPGKQTEDREPKEGGE